MTNTSVTLIVRSLPILPVELVDEIVGEASRTLYSEPNMSSLSSIALASHLCRIQANRARFSEIKIRFHSLTKDINGTSGIKGLAAVIKSGQFVTTMPGVCACATSFALWISGPPDEIHKALEGGSITYILNNLFRVESTSLYTDSSGPLFGAGRCSLTLKIDIQYMFRRSWKENYPDLLKAFENLIMSCQLDRLVLGGPRELTQDLLIRSS